MKTISIIFGTMMAASLIAQNSNNSLPAMPPPVSSPAAETAPAAPAPAPETNPPAAAPKHKTHRTVHHHIIHEPSVTLPPGSAQVNATELVVRGQAGLKGEVVARLHKGDTVNVLEQINLAHHAPDEPSQWAKISYPSGADVWVSARYIVNGAVSTTKLNLRAGPGENYSVVGVVEQGTQVNQVETKGDWMKIEPPAGAYAFVAARYLTPTAVAVAPQPAPAPPEVPPTQTQVSPPQPIVTTPQPAPPSVPAPEVAPASTVRIIQHEGVVEPVGSLTAPTDYKLYDPDTKVDEDFLFPTSPNMHFDQLVDDRVIVTGEEGVEAQWPNTPVMAVQDVQVVATNVVQHFNRLELLPPRQRH